MGRATEAKAEIEAARLILLHKEQQKIRKRLNREIKVKKASPHLPGEERLKKNTAVLLKIGVPNISFAEIANRLGETKTTVRKWFKEDPDVKDFYSWALDNLRDGSLELMKTYSLEAVETLVLLMRFGSEKFMFESSREILDRIGVPKVQRTEIEREDIKSHQWADRDALVNEIRELPIEQQEAAIEALEKFEEMLADPSVNGNKEKEEESEDDEYSLEPIARSEEELEEDDEEDDD